MSNENFASFDPAEHLETKEAISAPLDSVMEDGGDDSAHNATTLGVAARARVLTRLANGVGMSRRELIGALTVDPPASGATATKIARALGLPLDIAAPSA